MKMNKTILESQIMPPKEQAWCVNEVNRMKTTKEKIIEITNAMQDLLLYKNEKYGDSALKPNNIFFKGDATNSILIRLDDKIGRIKNNKEPVPRTNDICDLIGYCILLLASLGIDKKEIEKFKD